MSITLNGYHSLSKTFEAATERLHELKQLKNKCNLLKSEWHAWSKLLDCRKGPTGIGFDQATDKFNALPEWWAKMKKDQNLEPSRFDAERLHWGYGNGKKMHGRLARLVTCWSWKECPIVQNFPAIAMIWEQRKWLIL
ncbi:hypothetical protein ACSBR2_032719 [Camellia fascicularis]